MESKHKQKLRGGFYTPEPISRFLAEWAIQTDTKSVLEPSCGDGNIVDAACTRCEEIGQTDLSLTGIELNEGEAEKTRTRVADQAAHTEILTKDFFDYCVDNLDGEGHRFDAVLGNPPFIRYQDFPDAQRDTALNILEESELSKTKRMNAWMPFLLGSAQLLSKDSGRLAMVVPASLLQVKYAKELRQFLTDQFSHLTIVTFRELLFDDVLEEVVLVLGERTEEDRAGINVVQLDNAKDLEEYNYRTFEQSDVKTVDHSTEKWILYYLDQDAIDLVRRLSDRSSVRKVGEYADVNVGVVTGRNKFFLQSHEEAARRGLNDHTDPIVTRSAHLGDGVKFTRDDYDLNVKGDRKALLFNPEEKGRENFSREVQAYIRSGERQDFHNGYKTGLRDYWYTVPTTWVPDGFLLRQIHDYPKLVYNLTDEATCTDTIHRVNYTGPSDEIKPFFAAMHNSLTWAFSEFIGRSYGGGILELEPNEAEELPVPTANWENISLDKVDRILRNEGHEAVLEYTDLILLEEGLELSKSEIAKLRDIRTTLQQRRLNRK